MKAILLPSAILFHVLLVMSVFAQSLNPEVIWAMPTSARIKCVTDVPGKMTVEYGTTPALGMTSPAEWRDWPNTDVARHYVILKGLQPDTQYYYRVRVAPADGGADLVSEVRTFRTLKPMEKLFNSVRYASYIIGDSWSSNDPNQPYHDWNAAHFDVNIAYNATNIPLLKEYRQGAIGIVYDNIIKTYARTISGRHSVWMYWADQQGISYERIAFHHAVDTEVDLSANSVSDIRFDYGFLMEWVSSQNRWYVYPFDNVKRFPTKVGDYVLIGNCLRYDIIYLNFKTVASGGYDGVWEYCSGVDENGFYTQWTPLTIVEDTTVVNGQKLAQNGHIRFVPPKERTEWKRARVRDNTTNAVQGYNPDPYRRVFYVRFRVTSTGTAPTFNAFTDIKNEDFVKVSANNKEIIPGWDASWETNPDNNGDPEYNPNPPTTGGLGVAKSARFKWWSRTWHYRPDILWFLCNPLDPYYAQFKSGFWVDYLLQTFPYMDGWYCDDFTVKAAPAKCLNPATPFILEKDPWNAYEVALAHGDLLEKIGIRMTAAGKITSANQLVSIAAGDDWSRPYTNTEPDRMWMYFVVGLSNRESSMYLNQYYTGPSNPYSSLATFFAEMSLRINKGTYFVPIFSYVNPTLSGNNTDDWWNREKMRALAQYLLVKDVDHEYLFLNAWHQNFIYGETLTTIGSKPPLPKQKAYYIYAAMRDIGLPITTVPPGYQQFVAYPNSWYPGVIPGLFIIHSTNQAPRYDSSGNFLGNTGVAYYFARRYSSGALVVLRTGNSPADERGLNEYTAFDLDGAYYLLDADNGLSSTPITRLNLRNGDGAVLVPAGQVSVPSVRLFISVDKSNPKPLDVVTMTIEARNMGSAATSDVEVRIPISGMTYEQGSLMPQDFTVDTSDRTVLKITIPTLAAGEAITLHLRLVVR